MNDNGTALWSSFSSLPEGYRAAVVGATGGIGSAICRLLNADPRCGELLTFGRTTDGFELTDEVSIERSAAQIARTPLHLLICATGVLSVNGFGPEKSLRQISPGNMIENFRINAVGPALVAKHFLPLLDRRDRSVVAFLSARVGSIGDNRLGGWVSYRASKAALNQIVKTASIEVARTHPEAIIVAMHPGTVSTSLSAPYTRKHHATEPDIASRRMLSTMDRLERNQTGSFVAYDGKPIVW